jgi:hypothetical protein
MLGSLAQLLLYSCMSGTVTEVRRPAQHVVAASHNMCGAAHVL